MAKTKCKVVVRKVIYEEIKACPFPADLSIREIARRTGLDPTYLSRVKRGVIPISEDGWDRVQKAIAEVAV